MTDEFRLVHADEFAAMYDLRARAFKQGTASDWAADIERDPWRDAGADLVALSDGQVVANVRVLARRITTFGGELRLAGFGDVASDPARRGQGYIRRLLALAHARNRSAGFDLAMLFTHSPWIYSGSAGFSALPFWWLDLDVPRAPAPAGGPWTIVPAELDRHLAGMQQVYDEFGQGRPGYPVRDRAYWTHPARAIDAGWTRVALDRTQRVVAYLRVLVRADGRATIQECPYVTSSSTAALVAGLADDPRLARCVSFGGRLPRNHALGPAGQWRVNADAMACPYTAAGADLLQALREPTNQRGVYWYGDGF
jgi:predicted N-acetyltransferase YhbS